MDISKQKSLAKVLVKRSNYMFIYVQDREKIGGVKIEDPSKFDLKSRQAFVAIWQHRMKSKGADQISQLIVNQAP